ncbi:hypothetical protein JCM33774_48050 [Actinophytocola sp. KF-1]
MSGAITSAAAAAAPSANLLRDGARVLGMGGDLLVTLGQGFRVPANGPQMLPLPMEALSRLLVNRQARFAVLPFQASSVTLT